MHYSREWDNAGMPHSIFFSSRGHAIHGSNHPGLGTPASHGCVRLSLGNAATLFALVSARGVSNTKIVVRGPDPPGYHAATQIPQRRQPARPAGLLGDSSVNGKPLLGVLREDEAGGARGGVSAPQWRASVPQTGEDRKNARFHPKWSAATCSLYTR